MATIKSHTDLEQSKKLAEVLPIESADMYFPFDGIETYPDIRNGLETETAVYCWSLAALLAQFPYELCDDAGNSSYLRINKEGDLYQLVYTSPYYNFEDIVTDRYEHFVDACYEMILKLHELNLL